MKNISDFVTNPKVLITRITVFSVCIFVVVYSWLQVSNNVSSDIQTEPAFFVETNIEIDAKAYILDALPNSHMIKPLETLRDTIVKAVRQLRAARPDASILLADRFAIRVQGANLKDNQSSTGFNELGTPTGKFFPSELLVGAGFAYKINAAIAVGVDVKALMAKYGENLSSNAYGADVSFAYSAKGLTAGVSVRNIGAKLPMLIRASGEYLVSGFRASAEVNYLLSGAIMASVGAEYGIKDMVFLRAGYHYGDAAKAVPSFASCGLGLKFFGVKLNAGYLLGSKTLGGTMLFGLGYEF